MLKECICPLDCENVRYAINEKEEFIDNPSEYCNNYQDVGQVLADLFTNDAITDNYKKIAESVTDGSGTVQSYKTEADSFAKLCKDIVSNDLSVVKVRLESSKYILTVMDKRLTFADKLAAFGKYIRYLLTLCK